jgi:hypothetical protein
MLQSYLCLLFLLHHYHCYRYHYQVHGGSPWLVGRGLTEHGATSLLVPALLNTVAATSTSMSTATATSPASVASVASAAGAVAGSTARLGLLFDSLPTCAKFAAVGDCSKVLATYFVVKPRQSE